MKMTEITPAYPPPEPLYPKCYAVNVTPEQQLLLPVVAVGVIAALVLFGVLSRWKLLNNSVVRERKVMPVDDGGWADKKTASAIHLAANTAFYQRQLRVLGNLLMEAGYEFSRDSSRYKPLTPELKHHLANQLEDCRLRIRAPYEDDESRKRQIAEAMKDGSAYNWLHILTEGAAENGWYITGAVPEWQIIHRK